MLPRTPLAAAIVISLTWFAQPAWAAPKHTYFKDVIAQSDTIAIVRLVEGPKRVNLKSKLDVLQVLKGTLKPGKHDIGYLDLPSGGPGEFIAFLDKDRNWTFSAIPLSHEKVDKDILAVRGFYDYNAHVVSPGLITLNQLKTYLKDGTLIYRFRGGVFFPQLGKLGWKKSSVTIIGAHDAVKDLTEVKGLPGKGFPEPPKASISSWWHGPAIDLEFSLAGSRRMHLVGKVDHLDAKTGELVVRYAVTEPPMLTQKTLEDYLADERRLPSYHTFRLTCPPTKEASKPLILMLTLGKESGIGQITGWGKGALSVSSMSYNGPSRRSAMLSANLPKKIADDLFAEDWVMRMTARTENGEYLVLAFNLGEPKRDATIPDAGVSNEVLYRLYCAPTGGKLQLHDGEKLRTINTFTVAFDAEIPLPNDKVQSK